MCICSSQNLEHDSEDAKPSSKIPTHLVVHTVNHCCGGVNVQRARKSILIGDSRQDLLGVEGFGFERNESMEEGKKKKAALAIGGDGLPQKEEIMGAAMDGLMDKLMAACCGCLQKAPTGRSGGPGTFIVAWDKSEEATVAFFDPVLDTDKNLCAISHWWDKSKLTEPVTVRRLEKEGLTAGSSPTWQTKVAPEVRGHVLELLEEFDGCFFDQVCINQKEHNEKYAHMSGMGPLFSYSTTICSGRNGVKDVPQEGFFNRAWAQQEFRYGQVRFAALPNDTNDAIKMIKRTFANNRLFSILDLCVDTGLSWVPSMETWRIDVVEKSDVMTDREKTLVKEIFDARSAYDMEKCLELVKELRAVCSWRGFDIDFSDMVYGHCVFPVDQIHGMASSVFFERTGCLLDYEDPVKAYKNVLALMGMKFAKNFEDGDPFGESCACSVFWQRNRWSNNPDPIVYEGAELLKTTSFKELAPNCEFHVQPEHETIAILQYKDKIGVGFMQGDGKIVVFGAMHIDDAPDRVKVGRLHFGSFARAQLSSSEFPREVYENLNESWMIDAGLSDLIEEVVKSGTSTKKEINCIGSCGGSFLDSFQEGKRIEAEQLEIEDDD